MRSRSRRSGALSAVAFLLLALAAPRAAAAASVVVEGKVSNGTAGAALPKSVTVTVMQFDKDRKEKARKDVQAGPDGGFRSEGWQGAPGDRFFASTEHAGVAYRGTSTSDSGTVQLNVTIYETTTDESVVRIASDTLTVIPDSGGVMEALGILRVENRSDRTYVGKAEAGETPAVLKLPVPDGAYDVAPQNEAASAIVRTGEGFATAEPLAPGESVVSFLYRVKVPAERWQLRRPVWYPTTRSNVLLSRGLTLDAPGFTYKGSVPLENRTYGRWDGPALEPGGRLTGTIGSDEAGSGLSWGLAAGLVALALVVLAVPLARRRRRRAPSERTRLIEEIAALDDALDAGSVSAEEHAERRAPLKQRLVELSAAEMTRRRPGRRTIVLPEAEADEARR